MAIQRWLSAPDIRALRDEYEAQFVDDADIAKLIGLEALVEDIRVRDSVRKAVQEWRCSRKLGRLSSFIERWALDVGASDRSPGRSNLSDARHGRTIRPARPLVYNRSPLRRSGRSSLTGVTAASDCPRAYLDPAGADQRGGGSDSPTGEPPASGRFVQVTCRSSTPRPSGYLVQAGSFIDTLARYGGASGAGAVRPGVRVATAGNRSRQRFSMGLERSKWS